MSIECCPLSLNEMLGRKGGKFLSKAESTCKNALPITSSLARQRTIHVHFSTSLTKLHMFVRTAQCRIWVKRLLQYRYSTSQASRPDILQCSKCSLFKFGDPTSESSKALFRDLTWRIRDESSSASVKNQDKPEAWALIGTRANVLVDSALLGRARADPPESRRWPIIGTSKPIEEVIKKVSFNTRLESNSYLSQGGEFTDYTARYYGIRKDDEDAITLKDHLRKYAKHEGLVEESDEDKVINDTARMLKLDHLLEIPLIALSNGQTRRARIARALLTKPGILILEEPFSRIYYPIRTEIESLMSVCTPSRSRRSFSANDSRSTWQAT